MRSTPPVVAEVVRSGFVEGRHRGCVVALAADGSVAFSRGDVEAPMFPRSANKPLQAAGMVGVGLTLTDELLALAAASHSGERFHLDGVRTILAGVGLGVEQLQTPPDLPHDTEVQRSWIRDGRGPEPIAMNCSGKHAAMLATCVVNGWDVTTYTDPGHPLQRALRSTVERLAGETVAATGVDGCGAPVLAISLRGLAQAGRACVLAPATTSERQVADAMRAHPQWVGGSNRDVSALMRGVPGLLAKDGAEAVSLVALSDGRAVAVKIEDGAQRARQVVTAAALVALGVDADVVNDQLTFELYGGGVPVGTVRAVDLV